MFDIFAGLFDHTMVTLKITPGEKQGLLYVVFYTAINTTIRAMSIGLLTYGAIRTVLTAVSHGSF